MRRDLVAVVPAFNCASTIARVVRGLRAHLRTVVVVDDGSSDGTGSRAEAAGAEVERLAGNRGKGYALRRGVARAMKHRPQAMILLDGDGQHDPGELPALLAAWDGGEADLVIGARLADPGAIPPLRYWTNTVGSRLLSWMAGVRLADSQSGYRIARTELLASMCLRSDGFAIESEMTLKAVRRGARIAHVPVRAIYGRNSVSHYRPISDTLRISWASVYFKLFDDA